MLLWPFALSRLKTKRGFDTLSVFAQTSDEDRSFEKRFFFVNSHFFNGLLCSRLALLARSTLTESQGETAMESGNQSQSLLVPGNAVTKPRCDRHYYRQKPQQFGFDLAKVLFLHHYCVVICSWRRMQGCQRCRFSAPTPCCADVRKSHALKCIKWQICEFTQAGLMSKPTSFQSATFY